MKHLTALLITFCAALLFALPVPKAVNDPATNLAAYLAYRTGGKLTPVCRAAQRGFVCTSKDLRIEEHEENATSVTAFKKASVRFNGALDILLHKAPFDATMKELEELERLRRQYLADRKSYIAPPSTPRKDALDRALIGNLEQLDVKDFDLAMDDPRTRLHIDGFRFVNGMKRTARGAAFAERILGQMRLEYTGAILETNATDEGYGMLPWLLGEWFDTNDTVRAGYVSRQLGSLFADELKSPFSGTLTLSTSYEGNDTIDVHLDSRNRSKRGTNDTLALYLTLRNASAFFTPARQPQHPGAPDIFFNTFHSFNAADGTPYRALLKKDERFAAYIGQYDTLLRQAFDRKRRKYAYSPVLTRWFTEAKTAFSDLLCGRADSLEVTVTNRSGLSAMQIFGMLMGQIMAAPPSAGQNSDGEKLIADTAAAHLEVEIKAR